jgi:DNA-binding transcriptional ArsR family regulator
MPARDVAALELSKLMGVLSHAHRVRIVEELQDGELDVNTLAERLGASHSRVSQQLGLLRSHRLVAERREGRHVYYRLAQPKLARWVTDGLEFLEDELARGAARKDILEEARTLWSGNGKRSKRSR